MLFSTLGQGYVFLLLLFLGMFVCILQLIFLIGFRGVKLLKNFCNAKNKTKNNKDNSFSAENLKSTTIRKISFISQENQQKNSKKSEIKIDRKYAKNIKKIIKKSTIIYFCQFLSAFTQTLLFTALIFAVVYFCDFGELRAYHFLAFFLGFWLIKTIFRNINTKIQLCDKIK